MIFNFDAPDTKAGFCPECFNLADIWDDKRGVWECCLCNWTGRIPKYEIPKAAKERLEWMKQKQDK